MVSVSGHAMQFNGQAIFDGKGLSGWSGDFTWWKVQDGTLTGESTAVKPCEKTNYLTWTGGEPADFEFECDFKLSLEGNSGIQIRSEPRPGFDTYGYQADMTGDGELIGYVYHHKHKLVAERGERVVLSPDGTRTATRFADKQALLDHFRQGDWNTYRIVCEGPKIMLFLNDILMCEITDLSDTGNKTRGIIALQMHRGPPMKVQFRNILLTHLTPADGVATSRP